jgi:hypothetical protein
MSINWYHQTHKHPYRLHYVNKWDRQVWKNRKKTWKCHVRPSWDERHSIDLYSRSTNRMRMKMWIRDQDNDLVLTGDPIRWTGY